MGDCWDEEWGTARRRKESEPVDSASPGDGKDIRIDAEANKISSPLYFQTRISVNQRQRSKGLNCVSIVALKRISQTPCHRVQHYYPP